MIAFTVNELIFLKLTRKSVSNFMSHVSEVILVVKSVFYKSIFYSHEQMHTTLTHMNTLVDMCMITFYPLGWLLQILSTKYIAPIYCSWFTNISSLTFVDLLINRTAVSLSRLNLLCFTKDCNLYISINCAKAYRILFVWLWVTMWIYVTHIKLKYFIQRNKDYNVLYK